MTGRHNRPTPEITHKVTPGDRPSAVRRALVWAAEMMGIGHRVRIHLEPSGSAHEGYIEVEHTSQRVLPMPRDMRDPAAPQFTDEDDTKPLGSRK